MKFDSVEEQKIYMDNLQWGIDLTYNILKADDENVPYDEIVYVFKTEGVKSYTGPVRTGVAIVDSQLTYRMLCWYLSVGKHFREQIVNDIIDMAEGDRSYIFQSFVDEDTIEKILAEKADNDKDTPFYQAAYFLLSTEAIPLAALFAMNFLLMLKGMDPIIVPTEKLEELQSLRERLFRTENTLPVVEFLKSCA